MFDRLKKIRIDRGLTQREFAEAIGVKQGTVAGYELGRREPQDVTIKAISNAFGVREEWIRSGEGRMTDSDDPSIDQIARMVDMTEDERSLIVNFLKLPKATRNQIIDAMRNALIREGKKPIPLEVRYPEDDAADEEEFFDIAAFEGNEDDDEYQAEARRAMDEVDNGE